MSDVLRLEGTDATGERMARRVEEALAGITIDPWGLSSEAEQRLKAVLAGFTPQERAALLVAAVRRMPERRAAGDGPGGALMYEVTSLLLRSKLPLTEAQLCEMLASSSHTCGHGVDTRGVFDLAHRHQQKHGYSPALGAAIRDYVGRIPGGAATVQALQRSAALLGVLDTDMGDVTRATSQWWINQVRASLTQIGGGERQAWERLVLSMSVSEHMVRPRKWDKVAVPFIDGVGADLVVARLRSWWPRPPVVSLQGSGAQLLKHFIWMLDLLPRAEGEPLVCSLAAIEWKPRPRPMAVLKPAAAYLVPATAPAAVTARRHFEALIAQG